MATTYTYSQLSNGQHLAFDRTVDRLAFGGLSDQASAVRLSFSGGNLGVTYAGKTIWLDGFTVGMFSQANIGFANGSNLFVGDGTTNLLADGYGQHVDLATSTVGNQVWGLGGADYVHTGSGADYLVGNDALTALNHVSRVGSTGSPTASYEPSISADGRFVGFEGVWTNFGGGDINVKDMQTGSVTSEDKSSTGVLSNSGSGSPVISADGKHLAFLSAAENLTSEPYQGGLYDIYVASVGTNAIERVSEGTGGVAAADGRSLEPDISGDGHYVVFKSSTSNWAAGGSTGTYDIFLKDRVDGSLTRVSTSLTGGDGNGDSEHASISNDGRFVVFDSAASNLTVGDTNGYRDIFVWDQVDGSVTNLTAYMTNVRNAANDCLNPDVAFDGGDGSGGYYGGWIVFETARGLVAADQNNATDIYAFNMADETFTLVSSRADGTSVQLSSHNASISGDGRFVAFESYSDDLVANDTSGRDIFVKDLVTGQIALVSRAPDGSAQNAGSSDPAISLGGDWIVFESWSTNLASTDGNGGFSDVFRVSNPLLRDTLEGGAGNDTYVIARNDAIVEAVGGGIDTVQSGISYTLAANLENLTLTGPANLAGTGNDAVNVIIGNAGSNSLNGGAGIDTVSYINASFGVAVNLALTSAQATGFGSDTLSNFENLFGSAYDDTLIGNAGDNRLDGHTGNDLLSGAGGSDMLVGGAGNDRLDGGLGTDTMYGGDGSDNYYCDASADVIVETGTSTTEIDTVISMVSWTLGANLENLTLNGTASINGTGNGLANVIFGNSGSNVLNGGDGIDTVSYANASGAMMVSLVGSMAQGIGNGNGNDIVSNFENVFGSRYNDELYGDAGNNRIDGYLGNDQLHGGAGDDLLVGGAGIDLLDGGLGNDRMVGGDGANSYFCDSAGDVITETGTDPSPIDTVSSTVSWTLGERLEVLFLRGTAHLNGTGNILGNMISGNAGNNVLNGGDGIDTAYYGEATTGVTVNLGLTSAQATGYGTDTLINFENLSGSNHNDTLTGNSTANTLRGFTGDDILIGAAGNDLLIGDGGNDRLNAGAGNDTMNGGDGSDTYYCDSSADVIVETGTGATDRDTVVATVSWTLGATLENLTLSGTDHINGTGNGLSNDIWGNAGNNVLNGGNGIDTVWYNTATAGVTVNLGLTSAQATGFGSDTLIGFESLFGSTFNDMLTGSAGDNRIDGNLGDDLLSGAAGNDMLVGGGGIDLLVGGLGRDTLYGNVGSDTFDFNDVAETGITSTTWDVIADFVRGQDRIDLATIDANTATAGNDAFAAFIGSATAFSAAGQLKFVAGVLYGNTDTDATAEFAIALTGITTLATSDLVL